MNPQLLRSLADRYTIERELGRGGMATVYLALDARHHRRVAVKVLHPELSAVIGSERFLKEIEVTAGLQHPHILPLFDSGDAEGQLYYVMPFVEGETLRARLDRENQLPIDDAVRIATEVASALEYAHKRHVVHRDVKPENILLHDGAAVVADFGIALAVQDAGGERITQTGLSLGTPQYMAPEQAMGDKTVGARADIYALGAVTYEMLVGEPPFTGATAQSIVAKMMTDEPVPPSRQRRSIPPPLESAVLRALEKIPADRWPSAQAFADAMTATQYAPLRRAPAKARASWVPWGIAAIAAVLAALGWLRRPPAPPSLPPTQLSILTPGGGQPGDGRLMDLSPDGERVVFRSFVNGRSTAYVQELSREEPTRLPTAEGGFDLHFGADGRTVYFGNVGRSQLTRVSLDAGTAVAIPNAPSAGFMVEAPDGSLWISTTGYHIYRVSPDGKVERRLAGVQPRLAHVLMQILPDGRKALAKDFVSNDGQLFALDLESGKLDTVLAFPIVEARYAAGHLTYVRPEGTLHAVAFDLGALRPVGLPVQIGSNVSLTGTGIAQFAMATNGTIAYVPAQPRELVLVDRSGLATPLTDARRNYHMPRLSPDGSTILIDLPSTDGRDVWMLDRATRVLSRVTSDHDGHDAIWSKDGRDVLYTSFKGGAFGVYRTRPGSGASRLIVQTERMAFTGTPMPDGKSFLTVVTEAKNGSQTDIALVDTTGKVTPLVAERYNEGWAVPSPSGRWMAFASTLTGQSEVYVRSLAGEADQVQISTTGGTEPVWSRDERELFYRADLDGRSDIMAARIDASGPFRVLSRARLFSADEFDAAVPHSNYDVTPDGKAFVFIRRTPLGRITVIQNLPELVRRLSSTK